MRGCEYYMLRPTVLCERGGEKFYRSIEPSGLLGLYLDTKLSQDEAKDLIFYLEKKMPYIRGVDTVAFSIYKYQCDSGAGDVVWSGRFRNHVAREQEYSDQNVGEFYQ